MRVALHIIAANRGTDKAYHTIKERIQSYNQLIVVDIFIDEALTLSPPGW